MSIVPNCRACEDAIHMTREQIRALVEATRLDESQLLAEDALYEQRVEACEVCTSLLGGSTCEHCGCIVCIRAMQLHRHCPHPGGAKW